MGPEKYLRNAIRALKADASGLLKALRKNAPETAKILKTKNCNKLATILDKMSVAEQSILEGAVKAMQAKPRGEKVLAEFFESLDSVAYTSSLGYINKYKVDDAIISGLTMKMLARESVAGVNSAVDFIAHTPESAKGVQALKVMASDLFNPSVPYLKNGRRVPGIEINGVGFSKEDWLRFLRGELEPVGDSFSATRGWRRIDTHLETKLNETYGYLRARIIDDVNNRVRNETGSFLFDVFKDAVEALK